MKNIPTKDAAKLILAILQCDEKTAKIELEKLNKVDNG